MLTIFVPDEGGATHFLHGGATYEARMVNGRLVVTVPQEYFRKQLLLGKNGLLWEQANPEAMAWIGQNETTTSGTIFPGSSRRVAAAPVAAVPVVAEVAPVANVKLRAPEGCSSYSHSGQSFEVGEDRTVMVTAALADVLRSHGFR
jgi:hypothetical protein